MNLVWIVRHLGQGFNGAVIMLLPMRNDTGNSELHER